MKKTEGAGSGVTGTEVLATRREEGLRLDLFLTGAFPALSRKEAKRLIDGHRVAVNGRLEPMASRLLRAGDRVAVRFRTGDGKPERPEPRVTVLYEDESCVAVAKPAGLPSGSTPAAPRRHAEALAGALVGGAVTLLHRLDKETSGVLLLAKTPRFAEALLDAFRAREVEKVYLALVRGGAPAEFQVRSLLEEGEAGRMRAVESGGVAAETSFRTLRSRGGYSLLEARPRTGRTHQIRVQLSQAGHPILGDSLYRGDAVARSGGRTLPVDRQMLHAWKLSFLHPVHGKPVEVVSPPPEDFRRLAEALFGGAVAR